MSDHYKYQPVPGESSQEGAYMRNPQQPSYYYHDANQYAAGSPQQGAQPPGQGAYQQPPATRSGLSSWVNFSNSDYLKGLALGAGVALVASNPKVQQAVVSGAVKLWASVQGGFEEVKEQIQDVKAELSQQE